MHSFECSGQEVVCAYAPAVFMLPVLRGAKNTDKYDPYTGQMRYEYGQISA